MDTESPHKQNGSQSELHRDRFDLNMSAPANDYQMQISGMMGSNKSPSQDGASGIGALPDDDRDTMKRKKLNLQFGNITGIPSALGMTGGGGTTKYKY